MKYQSCVFIGHFSPYTLGHETLMQKALSQSEKVLVVLGSHKQARSIRKPWNSQERIEMIKSTLNEEEKNRVYFIPIKDQLYNDTLWAIDLLSEVAKHSNKNDKIALICGEKDKSEYLSLFPQWDLIAIKSNAPSEKLEGIRNRYFTYDLTYQRYVSNSVSKFMDQFQKTEAFTSLKSDFDYVKNYKSQWSGPYDPIFFTVDAVCVRSAHFLLVRRKASPGKGQLALPGGFLEKGEEILHAAIRELREETAIKIDREKLKDYVVGSKTFGAPNRSSRGRVITEAFLFDFGVGDLIPVKGNSDADKAFWLPINEIKNREEEFFEDHFSILNYFCSKLK